MTNSTEKVLDHLIYLYNGYSKVYRAPTLPSRLQEIQKQFKNYHYNCRDLVIRESLIEHSGSLAILATAVYPFIKDPQVDLGKSLTMLAIHDIGELITGDEIVFTKKAKQATIEQKKGLELLPKSYHEIYLEIENYDTPTGKFAKAIDKFNPDLIDLIAPPEITIERFRVLVGKNPEDIVTLLSEFKHPFMMWNPFLADLHLTLLDRLDNKLKPFYKNK